MIYAQIGTSLRSYDGMSLEAVTQMLTEQNLIFTFITEEVYNQKIAEIEANRLGAPQ
jgi:hypothetical protein